jgi:antiviral helicase SKI2
MAELDAAAASADRVLSVRPDATKRLQILMQLNYLDEGQQLTLKGRVACELSTAADELLLSEAVCTGVLH